MFSRARVLSAQTFRNWAFGALATAAALAVLGCEGKSRGTAENLIQTQGCGRVELADQPRTRFPQATPFYLPFVRAASGVAGDGAEGATQSSCDTLVWDLASKPDASRGVTGELRRDASGISRFVPDAPGTYVFRLRVPNDGGDLDLLPILQEPQEVRLEVVSNAEIPFHNYNYTTTTALALADGLIWVTDAINGLVQGVDPATGSVVRQVVVGGWPVAVAVSSVAASPSGRSERLYVLQKASDSIAVIDPAGAQLVDSVFVGDEPSDLVVSPDGAVAYVSLATDAQVAVVDLVTLETVARIDVVRDPRHMALTKDGTTLYVASHRSGTNVRYPYPDAAPETQRDIAVVDTASRSVVRSFGDVGTTLQGLLLAPDEKTLFVSRLINNTKTPLAAPGNQSFLYEVAGLEVVTGEVVKSRGFQARPEVEGDLPLVAPVGMALEGDGLWVVFEASDVALRLSLADLAETDRFAVPGRPRSVLVAGERLWMHGPQSFQLSDVTLATKALRTSTISEVDKRGELLARGQSYFTGVGQAYAKGWSCNSCHVEGLTDTLVWNAGPVKDTHISKPFFWLEGTAPLGWQGYMSSVRNYSYEVHSNIGIRATDVNVAPLQAYMRSLTVPPAANTLTERDGSLSLEARIGQEIFDGKGRCAACHALPIGTNGRTYDPSSTEDAADVPSVVGSYRQGIWLKHGEATTLRAAIDNMADFAGAELTDDEKNSLERYLKELTGREFFLMSANPDSKKPLGSAVATAEIALDVATEFELVFSLPVLNTPENLSKVRLVDASGSFVETAVRVDTPRLLRVAPAPGQFLAPASRYRISIDKDFESFDARSIQGRQDVTFVTAEISALRFEGAYTMRFYVPRLVFSPGGNRFDTSNPMPVDVPLQAVPTAAGADVTLDLKAGLSFPTRAVVSGNQLYIPPTPVPAGPISFVDGFSGYWGTFVDSHGDGIGDTSNGRFTYAGPGFKIEGLKWELVKNP